MDSHQATVSPIVKSRAFETEKSCDAFACTLCIKMDNIASNDWEI